MIEIPLSDWETRRLAALYNLEILDTKPETDFDNIVALATQLSGWPMATISFMDHHRTWIKAAIGLGNMEIPAHREYREAMIISPNPIAIHDALLDPRVANHPFVINNPKVRGFAIFPLQTAEGYTLGHLGVADTKPGTLTEKQHQAIEMLAQQTLSLLNLRLRIIKMRQMETQSKKIIDQISPVFNNAIDAVIMSTEDGRISRWNTRAVELFGWTAEEAIGAALHELLIPEENYPIFLEHFRILLAKEEDAASNRYDMIIKRKDGELRTIDIGVSTAFIDGERLFIGFARDITESRQIARELAIQKNFYENILNKIPTDIAVFDADHRYLFVNPFAIGNPEFREFIIGKDDFEYAAYRNRDNALAIQRRAKFLKAKITGKSIAWEDQGRNADGELITHLRNFYPIHDEYGRLSLVIGYGIDITDRKDMEEKQNVLVERLSFQNTQLFDFCNIVTHNLRGPLDNMSILIEMISDSSDQNEKDEMVSKLQPLIDGLRQTFNQLVETIQIKQDLEIRSERVNLEACLKKTMEGLEMEVKKAMARVVIDCSDAPELNFPPKYIDSIFHNLMSNALKYRSAKRRLVVRVTTKQVGSSIFLSVEDNGLGIDMKKNKEHVFKIGKVFHNHSNAKGLGLYMTKSQVEMMGGSIAVESEVEKGTKFTIEFINQEKFADSAV
ncbi:PAS domain S-box-containing protein [Pedobacter sp. CAN_A7]|uniref:GAF domain-containing sensor histidine kinase n=1 Tax=Pedobacter sp. CAN_A7 TaxID=2787722 RepID=UPI0018C99BC6